MSSLADDSNMFHIGSSCLVFDRRFECTVLDFIPASISHARFWTAVFSCLRVRDFLKSFRCV